MKTLIAVSECGSFSEAAKRVFVSQAAIGQQMKRLENMIETELFDRSKNPPVLNSRGRSIVPRAREVVRSYENLLAEMNGEFMLQGELSLGAVPSTIRGLIPISIKSLVENYPDLHIRVVAGTSGELHELIERGALDAAVLSRPNKIGPNLHWQTIVEEDLVLLTSRDVEEREPKFLLSTLPYVRLTGRTSVRQLADEWLTDNDISVRPTMEMDSLETLSSMIAHNLGVSIVPNFCVQDPIFASLRKIELQGTSKPRVLGMMTRVDCLKLNFVDALLNELKRTVVDHATTDTPKETL